MILQKQLNLNLELNRKRKNMAKIEKPKWKINIEKEIETMRVEMLILIKIERNKYLKTRKTKKLMRKYKITSANDIPSIKEELKEKVKVKAQ